MIEGLPPDRILADPGVLVDATGRFSGQPLAVVRPRSVDEVSTVVAWCRRTGTPLVPQGGNTGLVGGGVPRGGELVLSTVALRGVEVDGDQVTAGAGATLAEVQQAAAAAGRRYPIDLAARDSATIGGTVATNAGGNHVLRHGMTRRHLLGVEAVLGTGDVVRHLGGLVKDNTGFDLAGLLCGSEGTLGVVTAVRLALVPAPEATAVALVGVDDLAAAVALVQSLRLPELEAAEVVLADGVALVGLPSILEPVPPVTLLLEATVTADRLAEALVDVPGPSAVADDSPGRAALWRIREEHNAAIARLGPPHKYDVTLPLARLDEGVARARQVVADLAPDARLWVFGHVGDGNLHLNVTGLAPDDERVDAAVLGLVAELGGSISAEHGIGVAKRDFLHLARSPAELAAFRAIKAALDPDGILNPGVLV